jgi:hypothetical protein
MIKFSKKELMEAYLIKGHSVSVIARNFGVSENKVNYWLKKFEIPKRRISDALYLKHNPEGDPFSFNKPKNNKQWFLFGLGLGIYWGEGNKRNMSTVRIGNTDPKLVKNFILFLEQIYKIDRNKLKFGLQIFSDTEPLIAKNFWVNQLNIKNEQFQTVILTPSHKVGTYKYKSQFGVLTVYFYNTKLQKQLRTLIENCPFV